MKIKRIKKEEFLDVHAWNGNVIIKVEINNAQFDGRHPESISIKLSKKETTQLINALRAQRKRKGIK